VPASIKSVLFNVTAVRDVNVKEFPALTVFAYQSEVNNTSLESWLKLTDAFLRVVGSIPISDN